MSTTSNLNNSLMMSKPSDMSSEPGLGESDFETLFSPFNKPSTLPKDYWFGKKYFECVLAQSLLCSTPLHEDVVEIDSKLDEIRRSYPYLQTIHRLHGAGIAIGSDQQTWEADAYQILLCLIGKLVRAGTRDERAKMIFLLRDSANMEEVFDTDTAFVNTPTGQTTTRDLDPTNEELAPYTIALKEHGDRIGVAPVYKTSTVSLNPPSFRAVVYFQGRTFVGQARNKKHAGHYAAQKACRALGLNVKD